jgi:hypothetical protein
MNLSRRNCVSKSPHTWFGKAFYRVYAWLLFYQPLYTRGEWASFRSFRRTQKYNKRQWLYYLPFWLLSVSSAMIIHSRSSFPRSSSPVSALCRSRQGVCFSCERCYARWDAMEILHDNSLDCEWCLLHHIKSRLAKCFTHMEQLERLLCHSSTLRAVTIHEPR